MRKKLQRIYWLSILITMLAAVLIIALMLTLRIDDTRANLRIMAQAAAEWTLDSTESLQTLSEDIASLSPPLRVTFLMNHGLVLADSDFNSLSMKNHFDRPEIQSALQNGTGESIRLSETLTTITLNIATRISDTLIMRLSYPLSEIVHILLGYSAGLIALFVVLYILQRRALTKFARSMVEQLNDVRLLLEGKMERVIARFPEFQPALDHISYLAERLNTDLKEVSRTLNLRSDFVAHASHELRSPLTSIMGFAEMLDEGMVDTPEETAICLSAIRNECQRMLDVIQDILHLSHAENQPTQEQTSLYVHHLADEICNALKPQAAQKNISLHVEGEMQLLAIEKDLWEILYNLTSNAIHYGRENGYVHVKLTAHTITVEDNGIGIASEHVPHLFEQFYRVDEARGMSHGGTGLGLSIVRALCNRYNADIRVESEPDHGSSFIICFPEQADVEKEENAACRKK